MTPVVIRKLGLLGIGLTLSACAPYEPARANCFNFRDAPVRSEASTTATISTMGVAETHRDTACDFALLGPGD